MWGDVRGGMPRGGVETDLKAGDSPAPQPQIPAGHVSLFDARVTKKSMHGHYRHVLNY